MKRLLAPPARAPQAAKASPPATQPASTRAGPAPSLTTRTPDATIRSAETAKGSSPKAAASHGVSAWKGIVAGGASSRLTAHITRLDRSPNAMVLHLDNGQVWRQIGRASGDLSLHTGDRVTIEKRLGSYWLSSRYVSDMRVRLEPR